MKKLIVTYILAAAFITTGYAETDLLQVVRQAMNFDKTFQAAKANYLAETEAYPQALALLYPNIQFSGFISTGYNKTYQGFLGTPINNGNIKGYQYTLTLTQPVINFNTWWGVCQASYQVKAAAATYAAAAQDLLLRTAQAYFSVLQAQDTVRFTEAELLANKQQFDQAKQRFEVGLDAITSVYNAEASYDQTIAQLIAAKNQVLNTKEELSEITGIYYNNLATLKREMPLLTPDPTDVEKWIDKSNNFNFQLQSARFTAEAARQGIKVAFAGHLPVINFVGTSQRTRLGDPEEGVGGATDSRTNTAALQLSMPLYQGGLINSQVRQQEYNYQNAIAQMEGIHQQVMVNLRQTYNSIMSGISKVRADKQAVISQQASVASTDAAVRVGTRTIFELLQAQQLLFQAQTTLAQDQYLYINNTLQFKQLAGTLTYKDLQAINTWLKGQPPIRSPYDNVIDGRKLLVTKKSSWPINTHPCSWIQSIHDNSFKKQLRRRTAKVNAEEAAKSANYARDYYATPPRSGLRSSVPKHKTLKSTNSYITKIPASAYKTTHPRHHRSQQMINKKLYSIQLMARDNKKPLTQFIKHNNLAHKTFIRHTHVNGKNWYVLLYGDYANKSEAHTALRNLPASLQNTHPWVRPINN